MSIISRFLSRLPLIGSDPDSTNNPNAWLSSDEVELVPPRNLWIGPADSISHYYRWIWEYLAYLTVIVELQREQAVLELGCGHGRLARGLISYLRAPGRYVGLDIDAQRIADAQQRISARYANFQFLRADVYSQQYNPAGNVAAAEYVFPFADASFDCIFAGSLFTHLLPDETRRYFCESRRVLKPGGLCLFSYFLLDNYRGPNTSIAPAYGFDHPYLETGVAVNDAARPAFGIAYSAAKLECYAQAAGLQLVRHYPGYWTESPGWAVNEQDLVLLRRV